MGSARVGSNPADVVRFCFDGTWPCHDTAEAPLVEWSNTLRSGRSPHLRAQVRILQGALFAGSQVGDRTQGGT